MGAVWLCAGSEPVNRPFSAAKMRSKMFGTCTVMPSKGGR